MYRLDREEFVQSRFLSLWSTLAFQAGFLNAFGFLACGRYVSHVTGFGTQIGIALAKNTPAFAVELLGFPLAFIFGSFVNSSMTSARIELGRIPRFDRVVALLPLILTFLLICSELGVFGVFGEELLLFHDFMLLFLLCFVCGLQNGCFATMTKGQIRTTHLTGICTDIGTDLGRIWFGRLKEKELELTKLVNISRFWTVFFYTLGSVLSVLVSGKLGYSALIVPWITSIAVFFRMRSWGRNLRDAARASVRQGSEAEFNKEVFR